MSRIDSTGSGVQAANWANDSGQIGGRNGSPGAANVFDTGGAGETESSGDRSDTEQIIGLLDKWVIAFETADTGLLDEVFSSNSPLRPYIEDAAWIEGLRQANIDYVIFSFSISTIDETRAIADVDIESLPGGLAPAERGWNRFEFLKVTGQWKMVMP